jgi:hypothetical protein
MDELQDAMKDIFGSLFEAILQGETQITKVTLAKT